MRDPTDTLPHLSWTPDGAPRSDRFGDVYFSRDDGLAESRAVFLAGCGLPEAWAGRDHYTIAELGFGTGLNIAAVIDLWRATRSDRDRLHLFSIEAYPLRRDEAARALSAWPDLQAASALLLDRWPAGTPGFHRIDIPTLGITLDLAVGDATWALDQWSGRADAWFLDGFSPALNPHMWSDAVLDGIAARSAQSARLATFTVAGSVRRGLAERGFTVDKRPGHGRKHERLEARLTRPESAASPARTALVIGAGIAGATVARALRDQGLQVTVLDESAPGAGASGFPSALVTPRLDAGDAGIAGFHAQALERAKQLYGTVPGAILEAGVVRLEQAGRDVRRFDRIADQTIWPPQGMTRLDASQTSARLGEAAPGGLLMADAMAVFPKAILDAWLGPVTIAQVASLDRAADGWRVLDGQGTVITTADVVIVTAGWGAAELLPSLGLSPVRGQASWVEGVGAPTVAWGVYVAPTLTGCLFGATHDRDQTDTTARGEDDARNLSAVARTLPTLATRLADHPIHGRAAVRAVTPDRLPVCGAVDPGLFVLGGLGSRGFCTAPLLGEHLAALVSGTPSPLPQAMADRLSVRQGLA